jgi:predicted nuclease of restriction endonuclease-like (RecB) superfamily
MSAKLKNTVKGSVVQSQAETSKSGPTRQIGHPLGDQLRTPPSNLNELTLRVQEIWESARSSVARSVNSTMVLAYWLIGREIVEIEQGGAERASYGSGLLNDLSQRLTEELGTGFSPQNLRNMREFFLIYRDRLAEICYPGGSKSAAQRIRYPAGSKSVESSKQEPVSHKSAGFHPDLSWSHYRAIMRVKNPDARSFYEIEATKCGWNKAQLERQINTLLYERLAKSRDKDGVMALANEGHVVRNPMDLLKDPFVLEFLDLPESHLLSETKLETALIGQLQHFLLEMGEGFAYVGRQKRLTLEADHFYPDLVFYHIRLRCYVVIDLKLAKLSHADLGQMLLYVNFYDKEVCVEGDQPTVGLILCTDQNETVAKYVLDDKAQRIFASKYQAQLPSVEVLEAELRREREIFENAQHAQRGPLAVMRKRREEGAVDLTTKSTGSTKKEFKGKEGRR